MGGVAVGEHRRRHCQDRLDEEGRLLGRQRDKVGQDVVQEWCARSGVHLLDDLHRARPPRQKLHRRHLRAPHTLLSRTTRSWHLLFDISDARALAKHAWRLILPASPPGSSP